jgi:hypothetical protein
MSATTVLYHKFYSERHGAGVAAVSKDAERFRAERGFEPPYWEMLKMARRALATTPG